jgi:hypothetical protein
MNEAIARELMELFESVIDSSADIQAKNRLAELLQDYPEARQAYVEQCQMHAMLAWEHGSLTEVAFVEPTAMELSALERTAFMRSVNRWRWLAMAASVLLVVSLGWLSLKTFRSTGDTTVVQSSIVVPPNQMSTADWNALGTVATLKSRPGAKLVSTDILAELEAGDEIKPGNYELVNGFVELAFINGVEVIIESPAQFEIASSMRMVLNRGSLSAAVSTAGVGFAVETPTVNLIDHGTEFAVQVLPDVGSEVHVFNGEVSVEPWLAPSDSAKVRLMSNEATRVRNASGIPEGIDIAHDRFTRRLNEPTANESDYLRILNALKPTTLLRMSPALDGVMLIDQGSAGTNGILASNTSVAPSFRPGQVGSSLFLAGPGSEVYAKIENYSRAKNGEITVCAWVRAESRPRWAAIAKHWALEIDKQTKAYFGPGGQFHFGLYQDDGDLEVQVQDSSGKVVGLRENKPIPLGVWQHVAFVADGDSVRLYRNGQQVASAKSHGLSTSGPSALGVGVKLSPDGTRPDMRNPGYWHGRIDELAIFDSALTEKDLLNLYQSVIDGKPE